jgi:branched-chain amino acid transport system permease protein
MSVVKPALQWLGSPAGVSCWLLAALAVLTASTAGLSLLVNSIIIGLIWAMLAAGLTLVFGIMNVPNFAQGAFFMVGTLAAYHHHSALGVGAPGSLLRLVLPICIVIGSALIAAAIGFLVERTFLSALRRRSGEDWVTNTFVMTVAIAVLLVNLHQVLFGANTKGIVGYFPGYASFSVGSVTISADRMFAAMVGAATLVLLAVLLTKTRTGREMRAVSQDEAGARLVGISVEKIHSVTFSLSCGLAGLAGATLLFLFPSSPHVGDGPLYLAWTIVILAGLGNVVGTVVAGIAIALVNNNTSFLLGTTWTSVVPFALMVVLLLIRPTGLFGRATKGVWER